MSTQTAADVLHDLYIDIEDAEKISYLNPYGDDNAVRVGGKMFVIADDEDLVTWSTYERDTDGTWVDTSTDGGTTAEARTAGTRFLA